MASSIRRVTTVRLTVVTHKVHSQGVHASSAVVRKLPRVELGSVSHTADRVPRTCLTLTEHDRRDLFVLLAAITRPFGAMDGCGAW